MIILTVVDAALIKSVVTMASPLLPPNGAVPSSPAPQALGIIPVVATAVGCIVQASSPSSNAIDRPAGIPEKLQPFANF